MSTDGPNLGQIEYETQGTAWYAQAKELLRCLDGLVQPSVKDKDLATPPGGPANGDRYIVAGSPTGAWTGWAGRITRYQSSDGTGWESFVPKEGWTVWVDDENLWYDYDGAAWAARAAVSLATTTEVLTGTDATKQVTADALAALWEKGSDVASAATISLGEGGYLHITGTTTITDVDFATPKNGRAAICVFDGILTLTHNGTTLILPTGANITTAAGDVAVFVQDASDNVKCASYQRADGTALAGAISDGDKGDITVSASGATWTIDSAVVSLAKMADLAQDLFIGRTTASTGVPQTATITAAARTVLDDTSVGAMLTTLGGQPLDTDLTAIAALASAANLRPTATGSGTWALVDDTLSKRGTQVVTSAASLDPAISYAGAVAIGGEVLHVAYNLADAKWYSAPTRCGGTRGTNPTTQTADDTFFANTVAAVVRLKRWTDAGFTPQFLARGLLGNADAAETTTVAPAFNAYDSAGDFVTTVNAGVNLVNVGDTGTFVVVEAGWTDYAGTMYDFIRMYVWVKTSNAGFAASEQATELLLRFSK